MPSDTTTSSSAERPRVLITGAGGFIGANLARSLIAEGHEVHCVVRPACDPWRLESVRDAVTVHECDLTDADSTVDLVAEVEAPWTFHLAAHGAYSWQTDVQRIMASTFEATVNLGEACTAADACELIIHAGSSSEYGYKDHAPGEDEPVEPNSRYAVGKAASTLYLRSLAQSTALRTVTLRIYSAYGPWEEPSRFIPTLASHGLRGELPDLVDPDTARDFVYVGDVCNAFLGAARSGSGERGAVFNVGTGKQRTVRNAVEVAVEALGINETPRFGSMPARSWDTSVWVADPRRIEAELGWAPRHDLRSGFATFLEWLRGDDVPRERYGLGG